jgi:hypothetical protein
MSALASDVSETVAYSMDKWLIDRMPWALWVCGAGLVVVLHADSRGGNGAVLAFVYLALLGVAFAGFVLATLLERSGISFIVPIYILIYFVVIIIIAIVVAVFGGSLGSTVGVTRSLDWSMLVDPPANVFGWMLIYLGIGWVAFAVFRHFHPARPMLMLTPAIYEQHIAPKRRFFAPPGSEYMFKPEGEMMQVVLNSAEVAADIADYRIPIEMRWKAFRDQPRSAPPLVGLLATGVVYGRWSFDGSWRQVIHFLAPLVAMVAVVLHARNFR